VNPVDELRAIRRALYRKSLADFAAWAWPLVTGRELVANVATRAVIAALQAVADGRLSRLLVALPPGVGKSTLLAVYSAWRLARDARHRSIHASHAHSLAAQESRRVRRLVEGDAFRALFPEVKLRDDESAVDAWATTSDGRYRAVGVGSGLTGHRALEAVLDDPLAAGDRWSKAARDALWSWFQESLSTRLDGDRAPIVVVSQRLDRDDLIGRLLAEQAEAWHVLELPAEFDPEHRCVLLDDEGREVWRDPRTEPGELLAPTVLGRAKLDALRVQIGASAYACQYGQRPASDDDALIKRTWWRFHYGAHVSPNAPRPAGCDLEVPAVPTPSHPRVVIAADLTFGSMKGDYCAIQAWGSDGPGRFLLAAVRKRMGLLESVEAIKRMLEQWPSAAVLVEKAANGAGAIEELHAAGLATVRGVKPLGSKAERIGVVSAVIEAGNCYLPLGAPWLADFVEELAGGTKHDDQMDACAYALHELNTRAQPEINIAPIGGSFDPSTGAYHEFGPTSSTTSTTLTDEDRRALCSLF
jgi:predicted phage terminase large subunit-like protein